jgi:ketosteroid isomerase-like protein
MTKCLKLAVVALIMLAVVGGGQAMSGNYDPVAEKAKAEKVIKDSIRWVLNKDKALSYSCFAMDSSLFWFSPDNAGTISGAEAFKTLTEELFMNPAFKGVRSEFKDLRVTLSNSGDCAWWSCYLDDFNTWNDQPANWVNVRWTGVLEKIDGQWKIRQMHFSHALEDFQKKAAPPDTAATQK